VTPSVATPITATQTKDARFNINDSRDDIGHDVEDLTQSVATSHNLTPTEEDIRTRTLAANINGKREATPQRDAIFSIGELRDNIGQAVEKRTPSM
jgi:hypothetical protein